MKKNSKLLQKINSALTAGRYVDAINNLRKLLSEDASNIDYLLLMGEALMRNEGFSEAITYFARVVELDSKNIRALNNFGAALIRNRQLNDAKEILLYALEIDPKNIDVYINLGSVYQGLSLPEKSLEVAFKVIELNPTWFMAYNNLGCALGDLLQLGDAKEAYKTALALNPNYLPSIVNLAQLEIKSGDTLKGTQLYESALKIKNITKGEQEFIKYYLSHNYLYFGELEKGWDYYDYGFTDLLPKGAYRSPRRFAQPKWNGDLNEKRTILIWREQGLGDEILFSTCLNDIHNNDLDIILECDPRLVQIFQRTYPNFRVRGESIDSQYYPRHNDFELQIAIGSLPRYFRRNIKDFEKPQKIWKPKPDLVANISERLDPYKDKILVGICWRSGRLTVERNANYTTLGDWEVLLRNPKFQFVNLVYGDCEDEITEVENSYGIQILRWSDIDLRDDLESVLALMSELDCVVSIGSAAGLLAGAAGVNTLLLIFQSWVLQGHPEQYHWFPNVKPFTPVGDQTHVGVNIKNLEPFMTKNQKLV
jgi:tetratricopeptide (TPR) repeat protein